MTNLGSILKRRDITLPINVGLVKAMVFPVVMYGCESWTVKKAEHQKNWCFWTVVLQKTLVSPLDSKEIKPVHPKGNQSWIFIERTDAELFENEKSVALKRSQSSHKTGQVPSPEAWEDVTLLACRKLLYSNQSNKWWTFKGIVCVLFISAFATCSRIFSEKAMAPHSSTLSWKIPWMEEPGRLQSMGLLGVGYDWATSLSLFTFMHWRRKWQPPPVFLPGESEGRGSLVGCRLWGHTVSDTTDTT